MIGDSNQYKDGHGFDAAIRIKLAERFGLYASPLQIGLNSGATTGASAVQESHQTKPLGYRYIADGETVNNSTHNGIIVGNEDVPMDLSSTLRCHYAYSTFATGSGSFQVGVRRDESPWWVLEMDTQVDTNTGSEDYVVGQLDLAGHPDRAYPVSFKWTTPQNLPITGPFLAYTMRVEDIDKMNGISAQTIYGAGGQSLYDMNASLQSHEIEYLSNYFSELRKLQISAGQKPIVVIYINSALNDQNETSTPSWGWRASTDPDSASAYLDNLESLTKLFHDVWQFSGWDERELFFWLVPSHPISEPDADKLVSYRKAAYSLAHNSDRMSFVDFTNLTSYQEMYDNVWYLADGTDINHLYKVGYEALAQKLIDMIP
jgi:hypothetical protein